MTSFTITSEAELTPALLAKAFWSMDCDEQVEFFAALAAETQKSYEKSLTDKNAWFHGEYGEMQWCLLKDAIAKNPEASKQYMALSAWAYDFATPSLYVYGSEP